MTLNGLTARILHYFAEHDSFGADYITAVAVRPVCQI